MDKPLLQATITIEEITDREKVVKVKSHGRTYNVFKTKKDGKPTMAYQQLKDMELKAGMTVDIGYNDSQYEYQGTMTTSHNIAVFKEPSIQVKPDFDKIRAEQHQSIKEARRCDELTMLEKSHVISNLQQQPKFILQEKFKWEGKTERAISYSPDFMYIENGQVILEDVKGMETEVFRIKKKLLLKYLLDHHLDYKFIIT